MTYDDLTQEASDQGLEIKEKPLWGSDGRIKGNKIAIREDIETSVQKKCVLAEEIGHYCTTVGNIVRIQDVNGLKLERKARRWAHDLLINFEKLYQSKLNGCITLSEVAEYIGVTDEFLIEAIENLHMRYGDYLYTDKYIVSFDPFDIELRFPAEESSSIPVAYDNSSRSESCHVLPRKKRSKTSRKAQADIDRKLRELQEMCDIIGVDLNDYLFQKAEERKLYGGL